MESRAARNVSLAVGVWGLREKAVWSWGWPSRRMVLCAVNLNRWRAKGSIAARDITEHIARAPPFNGHNCPQPSKFRMAGRRLTHGR